MGNKNMITLFVLAVLFVALFAVGASALPDNPPTCSLSSSTTDTETTAVLTAVSVDTLANAGVDTIKIYENGALINTRDCGYATTCVSTKTVVKTSGGYYNYYAVCRDRAGQQTTSSTVRVHFDGLNRPPVIDTFTPATPFSMNEDQTQSFRITAHDPDGDSLTYEWKVDGVTVASSGTSYSFSRSVAGTSQSFVIAVYVRDGRGGVDVQTWSVTVRDLTPQVDLDGDSGLTECDTFTFDADVDSHDSISSYSWDFGDGTTGTGASVSHQFPEDGTYTV
ncbi:PKD domain-containing protein, partial [Candidatus Woesearchaeota archaeon]|nr:PKD domain-containing protein [Candidatus Woesearchaeota archaeon]